MKNVIKLVLPIAVIGLLAGCGGQSQATHDSSNKTTSSQSSSKQSSSKTSSDESTSTSESQSSESAASQSSSSQSSQSAQQSSGQQSSQSTAKATPAISQKTLASRITRLLSNQYAPQDLSMQFSQSQAGTYTIQVTENHQSANMKAQGADPNTSPTVAWFQTNSKGQLLESKDGGATYAVVGNAY